MKGISYYAFPGLKTIKHEFCAEDIMDEVEKTALKIWAVNECDLYSRWRKRNPTQARQFIMWYLRKNTTMKLGDIGKRYNRDHSTVINGMRMVEQATEETDPVFHEKIQQALTILNR